MVLAIALSFVAAGLAAEAEASGTSGAVNLRGPDLRDPRALRGPDRRDPRALRGPDFRDLRGSQSPVPAQQHDHAGHEQPAAQTPDAAPPVTDAEREAAFPDVGGHPAHDRSINYFVLFDQLEWQNRRDGSASWDTKGWVGGDVNRFWFRTEGDTEGDQLLAAHTHALYGRAIARWWDLVVGIRQDVRPGDPQTWAAIGLQGIAPYWFELQTTAYFGASGRTHFRVEGEYELLVTNRLVLQPLIELEVYGKADPEHGMGAGLSTADAGLRLRYEIRREVAPYVGFVWSRKFFGTADLAEAAGEEPATGRVTAGVRIWY